MWFYHSLYLATYYTTTLILGICNGIHELIVSWKYIYFNVDDSSSNEHFLKFYTMDEPLECR